MNILPRVKQLLIRVKNFINWRFLRYLGFACFGLGFLLTVISTAQANTALVAQGKEDRATIAADRLERQEVRAGQKELQRKLDAFVAFMNAQGYPVPPNLLDDDPTNDAEVSGNSDDSDSEGTDRKSDSKSGQPTPSQSAPANPGGNSGAPNGDNSDSGGSNGGGGGGDGGGDKGSNGSGGNGHGQGSDKPDKPSKSSKSDKPDKPSKSK